VWINVEIFNTTDQAYWAAWMALFTFPETTSGFLVLCLPVLPRFFKHTQAKLFPSTVKSTSAPPTGRGRTFEEGGQRPRNSNGRGQPQRRSWWHISAVSSKLSTLGSRLTGTTFTQNGTQRDSKAPKQIQKDDISLTFLSYGPPDLRLDCEDHDHVHLERDAYTRGMLHVHGEGDEAIYRQGSDVDLHGSPLRQHSHL
jgi:hypothetical protein